MSIDAQSQGQIRFGDFHFDLETAQLRGRDGILPLSGQPLQLLALLLQRRGQVVTREEVQNALWPTDSLADFDQKLTIALNRIRHVLADSSDSPRFIETLPGRGYRFIFPIAGTSATVGGISSLRLTPDIRFSLWPDPLSFLQRGPLWGRRQVMSIIVAVLLALAIIAVVFQILSSRDRSISFEHFETTKLTDNGAVSRVAISPDGRYVAYAALVGQTQELRLSETATRTDVRILLPDVGNFVGLTFSPDGNYIYFVRAGEDDLSSRDLFRMPALGGSARRLIKNVDSGVTFSPNGREMAYEHWVRNDMELMIANVDGTRSRLLTVVRNANRLSLGDPGPHWSSDGGTIAFSTLLVGEQRRWVLFAVSTLDGTRRELYSSPQELGRPVWLPLGDTLLLAHHDASIQRNQLWMVSFPEGTAHPFTDDTFNYSTNLDVTRDGATVAAATESAQSNIWSFSLPELTYGQQISFGPALLEVKESHEGKILSADGDGLLWVMNQDGVRQRNFGRAQKTGWFATCGPFVILSSHKAGSTVLTRLDVDGTHAIKLATGNLWSPSCSQDHEFVYYADTDWPEKIFRIPIEGGAPVQVTQILGDITGNVSVSPDGTRLAYAYATYSGARSLGRRLAVIPAIGGPPLKTFDVPEDNWSAGPYWTSDSKSLQYVRTENQVSNIWEQPLAGGPPKQLTHFSSGQIFDFSWSADHTRLLVTRGSVTSDVFLLNRLR